MVTSEFARTGSSLLVLFCSGVAFLVAFCIYPHKYVFVTPQLLVQVIVEISSYCLIRLISLIHISNRSILKSQYSICSCASPARDIIIHDFVANVAWKSLFARNISKNIEKLTKYAMLISDVNRFPH